MIDIRQLIREEYRKLLLSEDAKKATNQIKWVICQTLGIDKSDTQRVEKLFNDFKSTLLNTQANENNSIGWEVGLHIAKLYFSNMGNSEVKNDLSLIYQKLLTLEKQADEDIQRRIESGELKGAPVARKTGKIIPSEKLKSYLPSDYSYDLDICKTAAFKIQEYPKLKQIVDSINSLTMESAEQQADEIRQSEDTDTEGDVQHNGEYDIVEIKSAEEAMKYYNYTDDWCICNPDEEQNQFDIYSEKGRNTCYFLLKKGYQDVKEYDTEDGRLSMIGVFVTPKGDLKTVNGRDNIQIKNIMETLTEVLGCNPKSVLKPDREKIESELKRIKQLPVVKEWENGNKMLEDYDKYEGNRNILVNSNYDIIYKRVYYFIDGLARVKLEDDTWNWLREDNGQLFSQDKFKDVSNFYDGFAAVQFEDDTWNWVRQDNGQLFSQDRFNNVYDFKNGLARVKLEDYTWNWVRQDNGQLFSQDKFKDVSNFYDGLAIVELEDGTCNWLRQDNGQLFTQDRFRYVYNFKNGLAQVIFEDDTYNWVRQDNGQLLSQYRFKDVSNFRYGLAIVELEDGTCNWVRQDNGQLFTQDSFKWISDFKEGLASVQFQDNSKGYIDKEGNLYDENKQPLKQTPTQNNAVQEKLKRVRHLCMLKD